MKKEIVGILICTLLIATMAIPISALNKVYEIEPEPILKDADVPVWEVGDSWTYEIEFFLRDPVNFSMGYNLSCDLVWTVTDDSGENYILKGKGKSISVIGYVESTVMVNSRFITLKTEMRVGKADLGIKSFNHTVRGYVFIKMGKLVIPLPIQVKTWRTTKFTPHRQILPFPLHDGKNGTFDSVDLEEEFGTTMFWGLVNLENENSSYPTGIQNYTCNEEQITVPAGTFDAYNVTSHGHGSYVRIHYNSDVGNAVSLYTKHVIENEIWWLIVEYKLISTTYTP